MQSIGDSHGCRQARSDAVGTVNYSCYGPKVVQAPRRADRDRFSPFSSIRFDGIPVCGSARSIEEARSVRRRSAPHHGLRSPSQRSACRRQASDQMIANPKRSLTPAAPRTQTPPAPIVTTSSGHRRLGSCDLGSARAAQPACGRWRGGSRSVSRSRAATPAGCRSAAETIHQPAPISSTRVPSEPFAPTIVSTASRLADAALIITVVREILRTASPSVCHGVRTQSRPPSRDRSAAGAVIRQQRGEQRLHALGAVDEEVGRFLDLPKVRPPS